MGDNLYPQVIPAGVVVKSVEETNAYIDENLNKSRVENMMLQYNKMSDELTHYKKIKSRWTIVDNIFNYGGLGITFVCGVATTVTAALTVPPLVPIVLAGITTAHVAFNATFVIGLSKPKKKANKDKCNLIDEYIKKVYVYIERARGDNIITVEELEGFNNLMREYNLMKSKELPDSNSANVNEIPIDLDIASMQKQADLQAKTIVMN